MHLLLIRILSLGGLGCLAASAFSSWFLVPMAARTEVGHAIIQATESELTPYFSVPVCSWLWLSC